MRRIPSISAMACLAMFFANLMLVLLSWILSAVGVESVRSLISGEGVRWFLGHYVDIIATPVLAWLLLLSVSYSSVCGSGLYETMRCLTNGKRLLLRQRLGLRVILVTLLIITIMMALLIFMPHAILLSPVGNIFPSSFSHSIVPTLAGTITLLSIIYGLVSGKINSVNSTFKCLYCKIHVLFPIFLVYIFAAQLFSCFIFVFQY
ncbi:MAG: ABC transporter substrate-binding protein [Prevotella sp.]|uniref:ABC transporter substrate-binding protein n=1 Tax=Prevotella sp. TaxID=59823 RepID=UPI002A324491|nr:ABC transporter substrate-binding protein [Prevotella sp.]MDD7318144.1 ABC transporter substrate-binding protein [Prevotellaceae bacterium]MDY4020967.1 ABC transporter substrate-binding protein [Prevotella sp.]